MNNSVKNLKKGFDIRLKGKAETKHLDVAQPSLFALKPTDIIGIAPIPKVTVKEGEEVRAGEPLFFDKPSPDIIYSAPVSGEVVEVRRGPKRAIHEIVILADSEIQFHEYGKMNIESASREEIISRMLASGAWPLIRQRPFNVIAKPAETPRDVYISCFDTAPLGADQNYVIQGKEKYFQHGLNVLGKLTSGSVHLGVTTTSAEVYKRAEGVKIHSFNGPHPAGNVGVHIHHTAAIGKGDLIWTLKPQDVAIIGKLFMEGIFDAERTVAFAGDELKSTGYFKTRIGASIKSVVENNVNHENVRYISGNVLSGTRIKSDGFVGLYDDLISVIEEGNEQEFLGWLFPSYPRPSLSRTFPSFLFPNREYHVNSNNHGEERAYVMTGQYEKVMPMDVLPQHLIKSILYEDFDQMEGLGIYEVVEEDLALCEFVCTSKQPVQKILRDGLDLVRLEG
ncbi:MAG: Na(+)-translocating NADH-quinone reductase subunit A [Rhodothermales bacterium]